MHDVFVSVNVGVKCEVMFFGKTFGVVKFVGDVFGDSERVNYADEFMVIFGTDSCGSYDIVVNGNVCDCGGSRVGGADSWE